MGVCEREPEKDIYVYIYRERERERGRERERDGLKQPVGGGDHTADFFHVGELPPFVQHLPSRARISGCRANLVERIWLSGSDRADPLKSIW
jgi:hypothetical protein